MGNWQLEVGRMFIYITFPVALFHWFNQPENFESSIAEARTIINSQSQDVSRERLEEFIADFNKKADANHIKAMEEKYLASNE